MCFLFLSLFSHRGPNEYGGFWISILGDYITGKQMQTLPENLQAKLCCLPTEWPAAGETLINPWVSCCQGGVKTNAYSFVSLLMCNHWQPPYATPSVRAYLSDLSVVCSKSTCVLSVLLLKSWLYLSVASGSWHGGVCFCFKMTSDFI